MKFSGLDRYQHSTEEAATLHADFRQVTANVNLETPKLVDPASMAFDPAPRTGQT